jgi:hypothetical protein
VNVHGFSTSNGMFTFSANLGSSQVGGEAAWEAFQPSVIAIACYPIEIANHSIAIASNCPEIVPHWTETDTNGLEIDRYRAEIDSSAPEIAAH